MYNSTRLLLVTVNGYNLNRRRQYRLRNGHRLNPSRYDCGGVARVGACVCVGKANSIGRAGGEMEKKEKRIRKNNNNNNNDIKGDAETSAT